jgi:RNA polymerase sigma-70 factor, ECF subfamily
MPQSASELSSAMAAGDARAIGAFCRDYFDRMYRYARQATRGDEATCLDIVQDAMLRIVRTVRRVESEPQLIAWVRLVVRTTAYDYLKRESRRRVRESLATVGATSDRESDVDAEQLAWLRDQLSRLDPQLVKIIELRYEKRWTLSRIATAMGLKTGAVDGRLRRAIRELRSKAIDDE